MVKKNCKTCKKTFSSYKSDKRSYCSRECCYAGRSNPLNTDTHLQCSRCKEVKLNKEFIRNRWQKRGYQGVCKECMKLVNKRKYKDPKFVAWKNKYQKDNYEPARNMAHKKRDKLMKDECEKCGATERLEMHHPDYSEPLRVETLCVQCHADVTWNYA